MVDVITNIGILIGLLPLIILYCIQTKSKFKDSIAAIKPFLWLLFLGSLYELIFTGFLKVPAAYWFTFYTLIEFWAICFFYNYLFEKKYLKFFKIAVAVYSLAWLISLFFWDKPNHFQTESYFTVAESLVVYFFTVLWFKDMFKKSEEESLWRIPAFYFIISFLLYFTGTSFLFLLINDILKEIGNKGLKFMAVAVMSGYLMRILLIIGVWKSNRK